MRLIINAILPTTTFHLLNAHFGYISSYTAQIAGAEYDKFLPELEWFITLTQQTLANITHIYCITGPSPFTGGRIITLTLWTIAKIYPIKLVGLTLFEYWSILGNKYPMACGANATEYIVAVTATSPLELRPIQDLDLTTLNTWNLERSRLQEWQTRVHCNEIWDATNFETLSKYQASKTLNPLYLKKPNITLSR